MYKRQLREWLTKELRSWHRGKNVVKSIWKADVSSVFELLFVFNFDAKVITGYERLDAMRLIVNVFKHGDGPSLDELKEKYSEFVPDPLGGDGEYRSNYLDPVSYTHLDVYKRQVQLDGLASSPMKRAAQAPSRLALS